jgi:hypothetical protein
MYHPKFYVERMRLAGSTLLRLSVLQQIWQRPALLKYGHTVDIGVQWRAMPNQIKDRID